VNLCEELKKLEFESDWENSRVNPRPLQMTWVKFLLQGACRKRTPFSRSA